MNGKPSRSRLARSLNHVAEHRIAELGLEPGAFRGHDSPRVRNGHEILDTGGEHRESTGVIAIVHELLQFACSANTANEVDPFAGARIIDAKKGREHVFLEERDVEFFNGIVSRGKLRAKMQGAPCALEIKAQLMFSGGFR